MQKLLGELEQQIMDFVWANPGCSAEDCRQALNAQSRPLKESTVRTLLSRLEKKGYVTHETEGRTYLYRGSDAPNNVAAQAVKQIMDRFCGGSMEQLLVGMVDNKLVSRRELEALAKKIAQKKKERK